MRIILRIVGFVVGAGLGFVGGTIWMLSNDGIGSETSMKLGGGGLMLVGVVLVIAAIVPTSRRVPGNDNR